MEPIVDKEYPITTKEKVGYWDVGNGAFLFSSHEKPNIFHRVMCRWLLGFKWTDGQIGKDDRLTPWNYMEMDP